MSQDRRRKVKARFWPTWRYSLRWDDLDGCTGEGGTGLLAGLRTWWQVRRGTWKDHNPFLFEAEEVELCCAHAHVSCRPDCPNLPKAEEA